MGDGPKIDIGLKVDVKADLGEITGQFFEKVDKGAGGWFSSTITIRNARAKAKVAILEAETEAKIATIKQKAWIAGDEFEQKAFELIPQRALRDLQNIYAISEKASLQLKPGAKPQEIDDDWMANAVDKARLISNEEMQTLWSRVLAGEANKPGSFSRRTVNFLADLDRSDCEQFTKLCCFHCSVGSEATDAVPLVFDYNDPLYTKHGIDFELLSHLDSIGLITVDYAAGYRHDGPAYPFGYFDTQLTITLSEGITDKSVPIGIALYTKVGRELVQIAGGTPLPDFLSYIRGKWDHLFNPTT